MGRKKNCSKNWAIKCIMNLYTVVSIKEKNTLEFPCEIHLNFLDVQNKPNEAEKLCE